MNFKILALIKSADERVLRQYTKIGVKLNLDQENRKKYLIANALWLNHSVISIMTASPLFGDIETPIRFMINNSDFSYNVLGVLGKLDTENSEQGEAKAVHLGKYLFQNINLRVRLPIFLAGIGFILKPTVDVYYFFSEGRPIKAECFNYSIYGLGMLSLASSMYIKEIDPKLLQKKSLYEIAKNWLSHKLEILKPAPQPVPAPNFFKSQLD